ncbi:flagellin [Paenibacillus sp. FSL R7-269]|uniref:flagellin N-terminal helical domain-containing protein n=1 Tax=Paenibacillus sp. FSL R7-269 TaxID=1226755 RepID=UPI0003E28431|nr:flagellin [Paenibacillus sp. FSL R7-269]ETT49975.1 flagellin [Paenibacillus sp. FSL R7-269]
MIINHNVTALNTHRQLSTNTSNTSKNIEKLSSGLRINRAGDDAAGLAISEKMRGQIRGLDMASKNSQDGISLIQTAEGALNETHSILQRMRELAVQSASDTNSLDDRGQIQKEVNQLTEEIDRIAKTTEFNTKTLLNGDLSAAVTGQASSVAGKAALATSNVAATVVAGVSGAAANGQVGTHSITASVGVAGELTSSVKVSAGQTLASLGVTNVTGLAVGDNAATVAINGLTADSTVQDLIAAVNAAGTASTGATASINKDGYLTFTSKTVAGTELNLDSTTSTGNLSAVLFGGTNTAGTTTAASTNASATDLTISDTFTPANGTAVTTVDRTGYAPGANIVLGNKTDAAGITIEKGTAAALTAFTLTVNTVAAKNAIAAKDDTALKFQIGANANQDIKVDISKMDAQALNIKIGSNYQDVSTQNGAKTAITVFDDAIKNVSNERSKLGAFQNRLEHTINNLNTSSENLTAAESRVRDVDMAKEMMEQTKNNILAQAAQAMLAQANQQPQGVLQLLR